jgi:mannose-6-phosphate isomerase-like protein (cupin superfamily)
VPDCESFARTDASRSSRKRHVCRSAFASALLIGQSAWMTGNRRFHHRRLPDHSALLAGRDPRGAVAWKSDRLQLWFNNTNTEWHDDGSHAHRESDEIFVVLEGEVVVEVNGERITIGPGEFCCFPQGLRHAVVETHPPLRTFMIRAPSIDDKASF